MANFNKLENRAVTAWENRQWQGMRVWRKLPIWLPLLAMPMAAWQLFYEGPAWVLMSGLAITVYAGLKWLTLADFVEARAAQQKGATRPKTAAPPKTVPPQTAAGSATSAQMMNVWRAFGYLLLWPGMDPEAFFADDRPVVRPGLAQWLFAAGKFTLGLVLFVGAAWLVHQTPLGSLATADWLSAKEQLFLIGWIGVVGMGFLFHFGLFHLLALAWRRGGVDARPIMQAPILAHSLSDLWSRRWNLAFRDAAHRFVFQPLIKPIGSAGAMMAVFFVSGLVHDFVISVPARGGWGLPTLYFLLQGLGVLVERSRLGAKWGLRRGLHGRLFTVLIAVLPMPLLFHRAFIEQVVVPMLQAIGQVV